MAKKKTTAVAVNNTTALDSSIDDYQQLINGSKGTPHTGL
jgi:hypothetical protein